MTGDPFDMDYSGKQVNLIVYSSKTLNLRNVSVIPTQNGLGLECKYCDFEYAHERVWHILEVFKNSPAEIAGLEGESDYIIGTTQKPLKEKDDFSRMIQDLHGTPVDLMVYNAVKDTIRFVYVIPNSEWGGNGSLGCDIGYGVSHRIALKRGETDRPSRNPPSKQHSFSSDSHHKHNSHSNDESMTLLNHDDHHHHDSHEKCNGHHHVTDCGSHETNDVHRPNHKDTENVGNSATEHELHTNNEMMETLNNIEVVEQLNPTAIELELDTKMVKKKNTQSPSFTHKEQDITRILGARSRSPEPVPQSAGLERKSIDSPHFPTVATLTKNASKPSVITPIIVTELDINLEPSQSWSANSLNSK